MDIIDINLRKMLINRGYSTDNYSTDNCSNDNCSNDNCSTDNCSNNNCSNEWWDGNEKLKIIKTDLNIGVDYVSNLKNMMDTEEIRHIIIVRSGTTTPAATSALNEMKTLYKIEIFNIDDLMFDLLKFTDCVYEALTDKETKELLRAYKTKLSQVPKILFDDPIRKYYGWKKGTIIREKEGNKISYRVVV